MPTEGPQTPNRLGSGVSATDSAVLRAVVDPTQTASFRLNAEGEIQLVAGAKSLPDPQWTRSQGLVNPDTARQQVLLALRDEVESEEVEALAVSLWSDAGWVAPGVLTLTGPAQLSGPWKLPRELGRELELNNRFTQVYLLSVPPSRGEAIPQELRGFDPLMEAFTPGAPIGFELQIILGLKRIARRLAGCLRIPDTGFCWNPDPDSAVDLTVATDQVAEPRALAKILGTHIPGMQLRLPQAPLVMGDTLTSLPQLPPPPRPGQTTTQPSAQPQQLYPSDPRGLPIPYFIRGKIANKSTVVISVNQSPRIPEVLRWEPWAKPATLVLYNIHWEPGASQAAKLRPSRALRLERLRASRQIETLAAIIQGLVGGAIMDEDEFLVAL